MPITGVSWSFSDDLSPLLVGVTLALAVLSLALLALEARRAEARRALVVGLGAISVLLLALAILRPATVQLRSSSIGPKVMVLVDGSRRMQLADGDSTRRQRALELVGQLEGHFKEARLSVMEFADGALRPLEGAEDAALGQSSDFLQSLSRLQAELGEKPEAFVVVSDGRLSSPASSAELQRLPVAGLGVPIHAVQVADTTPKDASIRKVSTAGAAVAHQPLALTIEIGCAGGLLCGEVPVTVRELRYGSEPALLAQGVAKVVEGLGKVELELVLERAGTRVVEVAIAPPPGDTIPENDSRVLAFTVTRDRIRLLHIAGRPTYDVRALRMWLKSDESVDLIAFFILRTNEDDTQSDNSELALIPFPVDELFTEHLASFDAVVLQDIDAVAYRLLQYLPGLARYVEAGGGIIMVGGPTAFAGGRYAGTAIERVLPVALVSGKSPFDLSQFVPTYTEAGRAAPALRGLRELVGEALPEMPGANILGPARDNAIVLWEHPVLKASGQPMPVLALGEAGDGRSIALGIDGSYLLGFGSVGVQTAGRGFGSLWDGLLGWLMRDPRYEAARMELEGACIEGQKATLVLTRLPGAEGDVELTLERLGESSPTPEVKRYPANTAGPLKLELEGLKAGGYTARAQIGRAPPTRYDFACERGGEAWSDSRPDTPRLQAIAEATSGRFVGRRELGSLPVPKPAQVAAERRVSPWLPSWIWSLAAAVALGAAWLVRRQSGLV
jgi:uncharacterized membrane protein